MVLSLYEPFLIKLNTYSVVKLSTCKTAKMLITDFPGNVEGFYAGFPRDFCVEPSTLPGKSVINILAVLHVESFTTLYVLNFMKNGMGESVCCDGD